MINLSKFKTLTVFDKSRLLSISWASIILFFGVYVLIVQQLC